jgi:hypothetical protein
MLARYGDIQTPFTNGELRRHWQAEDKSFNFERLPFPSLILSFGTATRPLQKLRRTPVKTVTIRLAFFSADQAVDFGNADSR